jgi:hypothetical protein
MQCISTTASAWLAKVKGKGGYGLRRPTLKRAFTTLVISFCGILVSPHKWSQGLAGWWWCVAYIRHFVSMKWSNEWCEATHLLCVEGMQEQHKLSC